MKKEVPVCYSVFAKEIKQTNPFQKISHKEMTNETN